MTDEEFLTWLQSRIEHQFVRISFLQTTLITPGFDGTKDGTEEEVTRYEGNRTLAQLGDSLITLAVRDQKLLEDGASRNSAQDTITEIASRTEERAESLGIKAHLKLNKRLRGKADPRTLRLALCAIVGAVWLDCDKKFDIITGVVHRLLIGPVLSPCIDPKTLSSGLESPTSEGFFSEWVHENTYEDILSIPSDVPIVDMPVGAASSTTILLSEDGAAETAIQTAQPAQGLMQIQETTDPSQEHRSNLVPSFIEPATSVESLPTSSSHIELINVQPKTLPTRTLLPRKRRSSIDKTASQTPISDHLSDYIRLESERCHSLGVSFSPDDFDIAMATTAPNLNQDDLMFIRLKMLYFAVGSAESIVLLKNMAEIGRRSIAGKVPRDVQSLTTMERMRLVEDLNTKIAYNIFERRYHIYYLLVESRAAHQRTSDGFVNSSLQSISTYNAPRMGNPQNLDENQISKNLLIKLHPTLSPESPEYKRKLRSMSNIRKLGERFEILVERFGLGIIALLPFPADDLVTDPIFNVSDIFILSINHSVFASVVQCIDNLKGKALRETSSAVLPIVTAIFEREWTDSTTFAIERLEESQILKYPTGSQKLLELISSQITRPQ